MPKFQRIEARLESRADLKRVSESLDALGIELFKIERDPTINDEAALLLARERIKTTSQKLRKGQ